MTIKQLSVFLENRPGALLEFTRLLRQHDINMRALCLAEVAEYGVIRVIVDDTYELMNVLKNEGYVFQTTPSPLRTNPAPSFISWRRWKLPTSTWNTPMPLLHRKWGKRTSSSVSRILTRQERF